MDPFRKTKPELVIDHLKAIGRITDATARAQYGTFRLADAIYRLKGEKKHLVPRGKAIVAMRRKDVVGNTFAEYRLVPEGLANAR